MMSLRTHGVMDYVLGAILVLSPFIFGFSEITAARNLFLVLGFGLIGYSLITKYPLSVRKVIPLGIHMGMDVLAGVVLLIAPSVLGYRDLLDGLQNGLHYVLGLGAIALVVATRPRTNQGVRDFGKNEPVIDITRRAA